MSKTPRKVAFFNPKGGVGKTTTSTQTAVAITCNNMKVAFYDLDKQQTATYYFGTIGEKYRPYFLSSDLNEKAPDDTDIVIIDCPPNVDFIPSKDCLIVAPTSSTVLDLHAFRRVLELEQQGYKVVKVINNFNQIRNDDKALLAQLKNCAVITANSGIRHAMNSKKTIWNSNHPGGKKAKKQFTYLLNCIAKGEAPAITIADIDRISYEK